MGLLPINLVKAAQTLCEIMPYISWLNHTIILSFYEELKDGEGAA